MIRALRRLIAAGYGDWSVYASNIASLTLGSGTAQLLMAASTLLTARQLGVTTFGRYSACFGLASFSAVLFNLGLDNWMLRQGVYRAGELGSLTGKALLLKGICGIAWFGSMVAVFPRLNPATFPYPLLAVSAVTIWLEGIFALFGSVYKVQLRNQVAALLMAGARTLLLALTGVMVFLGLEQALPYAYTRLAAMSIAVLFAVFLLPTLPSARPVPPLREVLVGTAPFAVSDLLTSVYVQADTSLAALFLGEQMVGLYATASRLVNALFVIPSACYSVAVPMLVRAFRDREESINTSIALVVALFAALGTVLFGLTLSASRLLPVFLLGNSFRPSGDLLAILSPVILLKSLSFAGAVILVVVGWQKHRLYPQAVSAFVNVGLNLLLIPRFGVTGIAWVYVISEFVLLVGYATLVVRWLRRGPVSNGS